MNLQYDLDARALYIELSGGEVARTCEAGDNCHVDLDEEGRVTGIEVISVDSPWPLAAILEGYPVTDEDAAMLRACFPPDGDGMASAQAPVMSVTARRQPLARRGADDGWGRTVIRWYWPADARLPGEEARSEEDDRDDEDERGCEA